MLLLIWPFNTPTLNGALTLIAVNLARSHVHDDHTESLTCRGLFNDNLLPFLRNALRPAALTLCPGRHHDKVRLLRSQLA